MSRGLEKAHTENLKKVSRVFVDFQPIVQIGYIDIGDGCWRRNVLITKSF